MRRSIIIVGVLLILLVGSALAQNNLITNDGIDGIRIGDSANQDSHLFSEALSNYR